jgi:hypothetical protein
MPGGWKMDYDCKDPSNITMPLMRAALNGVVDATIDNTTIKDDERIFYHGIERKKSCSRVGCKTEERKYTLFPREVSVAVRDMADGKWFPSANLHYIIYHTTSNADGLCGLFKQGGEGTAAFLGAKNAIMNTAGKMGPIISLITATVSIGCSL